jgi:hypothetical protein
MTIFKHKDLPGIFKIYKNYPPATKLLGYTYTFVNLFTKEEYESSRNSLTHRRRSGLLKKKTLNLSDFTLVSVR